MTAVDLPTFLFARIAEDEAPTWELVDYDCEPGCCAPEGFVGHRCRICGTEEFGGTVAAITELSAEHDERIHRRSRVLAECEAKRLIVAEHGLVSADEDWSMADDHCRSDREMHPCPTLRFLAVPYADHPDYRQEWAP